MDNYLRRLKRNAATSDPEAMVQYIAALERAVGGNLEEQEHPYFTDARVASVWLRDQALEEEILDHNFSLFNGSIIHGESGNRIGYLIDVYWEQNYDSDDFEELGIELSDEVQQLFDDAAEQGYSLLVFWR